jgi:AI-2 transport protein TqsA
MLTSSGFSRTPRLLIIMASIVIVVAGMRAFAEPLNAFFLAALIAIVVAPLRSWLMKRGMSQGTSLAIVLLLVIAVGVLLVAFVGISTNQVIRKLPDYQERIDDLQTSTIAEIDRLGLSEQVGAALDFSNLQSLIPLATSVLQGILNSLGNVLLIFLFLLFMLMDAPNIPRRLRAALPPDSRWLDKASTFVLSVQRYMLLRTVWGVIIAAIQTVVMLVMGVDFAIQWGVLAVIANYIPNIGFVLGLTPPVIVTLLEKGPGMAILLIVLYSLINNVIENFVIPKFVGEDLNMSILFVFLSLIFWTWVLGAAGALLAVPLTLLLRIMLLDGDDEARPIVALMSETTGESVKS